MATIMNAIKDDKPTQTQDDCGADALVAFLMRPVAACAAAGAVIGHLVGLQPDDGLPLVMVSSDDTAAIPARSIVDLCGAHVGRQVVLHFEGGDYSKPIVMGVLRNGHARLLSQM